MSLFLLLFTFFGGFFLGSGSGFSRSDPDFLAHPDPKKVRSGSGKNRIRNTAYCTLESVIISRGFSTSAKPVRRCMCGKKPAAAATTNYFGQTIRAEPPPPPAP